MRTMPLAHRYYFHVEIPLVALLTSTIGCSGTSSNPGVSAAGNASVGGIVASGGAAAEKTTKAGGNLAGGQTSAATIGKSAAGSTGATTVGASSTGGNAATNNGANANKCGTALPAGAQPVDMTGASVIGAGSGDSCKFSDLSAAVAKGGKIKFNCGPAAVTIPVTATMNLPTDRDTVIDGGNTVTLDGGNSVQIFNYNSADFQATETRVTLQYLTLINGKTTPTQAIPTAPAPCSQGWNDGEGGALYMRDGNLTVIGCTFSHNQAAPLGPDTGGGAIYILGSKHGALIVGSTFTNNSASNAGAVGGLFATLDIYNSVFTNNTASGNGANNDDSSKCSVINNGQHEVGSGGNGGAIYQDGGNATNIVLCGDTITNNAAGTGAFGGGVFMTSNDWSGKIAIQDTEITGNTGGHWTQLKQGSVTDLGTAFGINALSATVSNSTLQK